MTDRGTNAASNHIEQRVVADLDDRLSVALTTLGTGLFWGNAATVPVSHELLRRPDRMDEAAAALVSDRHPAQPLSPIVTRVVHT